LTAVEMVLIHRINARNYKKIHVVAQKKAHRWIQTFRSVADGKENTKVRENY